MMEAVKMKMEMMEIMRRKVEVIKVEVVQKIEIMQIFIIAVTHYTFLEIIFLKNV